MKYDVAIIGAGLGGLQCAYILTRHGMNVCIIEKERTLGGCLQMFHRHGAAFDTGFHYVGGMDDGEPLNRLFRYFDLVDTLDWVQLDTHRFDLIDIGGLLFPFASGFDDFATTLLQYFPKERTSINRYKQLLESVNRNIFSAFDPDSESSANTQKLFAQSAYQYVNNTFHDSLLRQVVAGTSLKMELTPRLPLYTFAQINSSYIQSAWRLRGGGQQIADHLGASITRMGGTVITGSAVTALIEDDSCITTLSLADGNTISARYFISDIHPAATMTLLDKSHLVRSIYRKRLSSLPNTYGMFTVNCRLRPGSVVYRNYNIFNYTTDRLWHLYQREPHDPVQAVMISFPPPSAPDSPFTDCVDILTPISFDEVAPWQDSTPLHRCEQYDDFKAHIERQCIDIACRILPDLKGNIEQTYSSSPLTYQHYTATACGSAYGIRKDCNNLMRTLLSPRTPIQNLFLTGQNLNLHGILGTTMTSFITASQIIGPINPFLSKK